MLKTPTLGVAPGALPLLGHVVRLYRRPLEFLASLPSYGDLVEVRLGPLRAYLACHPDLVQQVLLNPRTFDKGGRFIDKVRVVAGNGLASSGWQDHRRQRRLMQPAFHSTRIAAYAAVMREEIDSVLGSWQAGQSIDVDDTMYALSMRVTTRTLFSNQVSDRVASEIQHWLPVTIQGIYDRTIMPFGLLERLPTPSNRRFNLALIRMRQVIEEMIRESHHAGDHDDLLSTLLSTRDEETGEHLDDREIRDQIMTLLLGGTETTGHSLAWTFHLLGEHPEIEERLHTEVDSVLAGRLPAFDDLPRLEYTRRVFTETLRLYPPAWIFTRITTSEVELAGRQLPAGTNVLYSPYVLHRNAALFPHPDRFDPDRWLPERAKAVPHGAMIPFGVGSRKCIGDNFGITKAMLTVAAIASHWRLRPVPGTKVQPVPKGTLGISPLHMVTEPRHTSST